jgi:hypothetical protein
MLIGCEKLANNKDVEDFISLRKTDQFNTLGFTGFQPSDISVLLGYRNDTISILKFPGTVS